MLLVKTEDDTPTALRPRKDGESPELRLGPRPDFPKFPVFATWSWNNFTFTDVRQEEQADKDKARNMWVKDTIILYRKSKIADHDATICGAK